VTVQRCKKGATIDANCFYTLRGSFIGVKQHALKEAMDQHEAVQEKLLGKGCGGKEMRFDLGIFEVNTEYWILEDLCMYSIV